MMRKRTCIFRYADLYRPILDKAAIMDGNTLILF